MFDKILIANRGEIACRVIDTARRLGVRTVVVFSDADRGARHVTMADEAVHIGPSPPAESYLNMHAILNAAAQTGAQAIHPGYGFLSENPDFVDAVEAAGMTFIGPSARAIRAMGLKDAAKGVMERAGVRVVPGYHGDNQHDDHLADAAARIGYPVLIKAVAGGGGKGMRRVERAQDFAAALASARGEARTAFGNDAVLIEKYITTPRHIEVQVFGDGRDAVHLFERDCSLQRRHQKVIEEAPAPGMTQALRRAMGEAAVRAAKAIGYKGAGTVEFIVDGSGGLDPDRFWFMEMNTRLQVEHPVSEAVTGVDLVEWQLRVAAGEPLPATQADLTLSGHAFEARLYAEDVAAGFLPATGTLTHLSFPDGVRVETGVRAGDKISPFYDPMIAKVIVHGPTRDIALKKLTRALQGTQIAGTLTNLGFLSALSQHTGFAAGQVDTGLIARHHPDLVTSPPPSDVLVAQAVLGAAGLGGAPAPQSGFTLWGGLSHSVALTLGGEPIDASVTLSGAGTACIRIAKVEISARWNGQAWVFGDQRAVPMARHGATISLFCDPCYHFDIPDPLERGQGATGPQNGVVAPMPGLVRAVTVAPGDVVEQGAPLAMLEAMKMEHTLTAPRAGRVAEVLVKAGAQVEAGAPLVTLEEDTQNEDTT